MAIKYNHEHKTITLHTEKTSYQMQITEVGQLLHLYYGKRLPDECLDHLFILMNSGFSPNCYEDRNTRRMSMDLEPQEYSSRNVGDFRVPAFECASATGAIGADLRYVSHEVLPGKYAIKGLPASFAGSDDVKTLVVYMTDAHTGLEVQLLYGVFEKADMITRAVRVENKGTQDVHLERVSSLTLDVPFGKWDVMHFYGRHCMERTPERVPVMHGVQSIYSARGASSHHENPFVVLLDHAADEDHGACIGFMPVYSGNHRTDIELDQAEQIRVVSGMNGDMFSWLLKPGEAFDSPEVILCYTESGLSDLSHHYHDFIREHIIRSTWNHKRRPILINNWEATGFNFTDEKIVAFAETAAPLGVEMLVLDDGWFGARDSENAGLGDWFCNEKKLVGGLEPMIEKINALGLKFGIWVEPEMVNEDSDLYRAHPEWALTIPGRKPAMGRNQLVLDMSNPEVVDYLYGRMHALLSENKIDYVKWDMNRNMADVYSHALPAERQGEVSHRYILGVYDLMERLVTEFPNVLFEGCAGGGGRFDAGILHYMPQIWCSDDSDAIERLTIQYGTSIGYPISTVGAHVTHCPNQQTGRTTPFGTRGVVAMSGTFGYELDPCTLSEDEKQQVRNQITRFDDFYDLIQNGLYYRLSDPMSEDVTAWQFVSRNREEVLVNAVVSRTRANPHGMHLALKGLDPNASYRLTGAWFEGCTAVLASERMRNARVFSGASLMYAGYTLPPMLGDYPSVQMRFERV